MPVTQRNDPYQAFNFRVEIDSIAHAEFKEASGLGAETAVIEYRSLDGNHVRKLPGLTKFHNIVLRWGTTKDRELWDWYENIRQRKPDRRNGAIVLQDSQRNDVVRWNFFDGWICKWDGPALDASANEVAIESIEIAHEGLELVD